MIRWQRSDEKAFFCKYVRMEHVGVWELSVTSVLVYNTVMYEIQNVFLCCASLVGVTLAQYQSPECAAGGGGGFG